MVIVTNKVDTRAAKGEPEEHSSADLERQVSRQIVKKHVVARLCKRRPKRVASGSLLVRHKSGRWVHVARRKMVLLFVAVAAGVIYVVPQGG